MSQRWLATLQWLVMTRRVVNFNKGNGTMSVDERVVVSGEAAVDELGSRRWYDDEGRLHREDGPAIERCNGDVEYWRHGKRHRLNGPAVVYRDGSCEWWANGVIHRFGGPAVERVDGYRAWYVNGMRHRVNGPAVEWSCGAQQFWVNDQLHREDGPAVDTLGNKEYWLHGTKISREEFEQLHKDTA